MTKFRISVEVEAEDASLAWELSDILDGHLADLMETSPFEQVKQIREFTYEVVE